MSDKFIIPQWSNKVAPCGGVDGCPAYTDIAGALHALSTGDAYKAWRIMMESHPLRAILGRVCYSFCEKPCNRGEYDSPISIQMLEAVIGDNGFDPEFRPELAPRNGKKVIIIGSGPAGLVAAWYLNIHGFETVLLEADEKAGGVLRYGIPAYRLPKDVLDREIKLIKDSGVEIRLDSRMTDEKLEKLIAKSEYHAAIVASGAGISKSTGIEGEDKTVNGIYFLREVNCDSEKTPDYTGKKVVVIGGGNVAMDSCRSSIRLGAESVTVVYRRTASMMPAHEHEVNQAIEEGITFRFLTTPESYDGKELTVRMMSLGTQDSSGRRRPEPTDEVGKMAADVVIMAIGQDPELWKSCERDNVHLVGDAAEDSMGTVIHAIASGKAAAESICRDLTGKEMFAPLAEEVPYKKLNIDRYFEPKMRLRTFSAPASRRRSGFEPVDSVVSLEEGVVEADRCFRCGMCLGGINSDCDWCFRACDEKDGINKFMVEWDHKGPLFEISSDCDGCGKCWEDCPRYVVTPVEIENDEE